MTTFIGRREFIATLGGAAAAWPLAALGQQPGPVRRIGMLVGRGAATTSNKNVAAFRDALQKLGWTDGRNVRFSDRFGLGAEELRAYAAELVGMAPDVLLAGNASALVPLQQATRTIPIVFANVPDPLASGFVTSVARPGGNITGFANYEQTVAVKWLELLKQLAPRVTRVAFIIDSANPAGPGYLHAIEAGASSFGVKVSGAAVHDADEIERIIDQFARTPNGGLIVPGSPATTTHRDLIIALAARHRLPSVTPLNDDVMAGALASYGIDAVELFRSAASYVDRVLRGEKPGDLPVQFATKYQLVINLKTAKALGLSVPPSLLAIADEVIE